MIRTGELTNSTLVARPLGRFRWITCASPDYLREYGIPQSPEHLSHHRAIHYFSGQNRRTDELRFVKGTETLSVSVRGQAAVNETGLYIIMCLEEFGLAQLAENVVSKHLQRGNTGRSSFGLAAAVSPGHVALSTSALSFSRRARFC